MAGSLHAANAEVTYSYTLEISHRVLGLEARDVLRLSCAADDFEIRAFLQPELIPANVVTVLMSRQYVGELAIVQLFKLKDDVCRFLLFSNVDSDELISLRLSQDVANVVGVELVEVEVGKERVLVLLSSGYLARFSDEIVGWRLACLQSSAKES